MALSNPSGMSGRTTYVDGAMIDVEGLLSKKRTVKVRATRSLGEQSSPDIVGLNEPRASAKFNARVRSGGVDALKEVPEINAPAEKSAAGEIRASRYAGAAISAAGALVGILNANAQYEQISARARLNIQLAGHQASEATSIGKEQALKEETKGYSRGQDTLVQSAAQGQSVTGVLAQGIQRGEELYGIANAMQAEVNSIREVFGFKAQEILYESDVAQAKINRDSAIASSVFQGGVSILAGGLF